jgi:hypothetical protein
MILGQLVAATLVVSIATSPSTNNSVQTLSLQQKNAATQAYVRPATACITNHVLSDGRFQRGQPAEHLGDLIVAAVPKCLEPIQAMIAAYDHYFGAGAGEDFFMGPYLDVLPNMLLRKASTSE